MRSIVHFALVSAIVVTTGLALDGGRLTPVQMERYHRLIHELIAPCCWRETIAIHRSPEALQMLGEVEQLVLDGRSEGEIKSLYVDRYGPRILADPPGNDWYWLYLIPIALFVSLMLVAFFRLHSLVAQSLPVNSGASREYLAQVRTETENDW